MRLRQPQATASSASRAHTKERRRQQLIDSTVDVIARDGFSELTMAKVARNAGLSTGIENFYFRTKEDLLVETLESLASEYRDAWKAALERAAGTPAHVRLARLIEVDLEPAVLNRKKVAVWFAFYGETKSRPLYRRICDERDSEHFAAVETLCREIVESGDYPDRDPESIANALTAMTDGLWLSLLLSYQKFDRGTASRAVFAQLAYAFPDHYRVPDAEHDGKAVVVGEQRLAKRA